MRPPQPPSIKADDGGIYHHQRSKLSGTGFPRAGPTNLLINSLLWAGLTVILAVACQDSTIVPIRQTSLRCDDCSTLTVLRIIDGDTLDTPAGRMRLFGIDAPERGKHCYNQATDGLRRLAGDTIRVEQGPRAQDRGGRLLFYVYTRGGNSIDETLLREGLAVAWTRDGQHRDLLVGLEEAARQAGNGCLWR